MRRAERKKAFFKAAIVAVCLILIAAFALKERFLSYAREVMTLRRIEVRAESALLRQTALDILKGLRGVSMLELDPEMVRRALEAQPLVRRAFVRKVLPDTLFVELEARKPFICVSKAGKLYTADREGVIIGRGCKIKGLPVLMDSPVDLALQVRFIREHEAAVRDVRWVRFLTPFLFELDWGDGTVVKIRTDVFLKRKGKWRRVVQAIRQQLGPVEYVDLSVPGIIFVREKGES